MNWSAFLFSFKGRITRKAFWLTALAAIVFGIALQFALPTPQVDPSVTDPSEAMSQAFGAIPLWFWVVELFLFYVGLAIYAKRWHDQDRSGWWSLLLLVPLIGPIIVLIMCGFIGGTPGPNRFGEQPMV